MNYKELTGKSIREGFLEFHKNNPHVYAAFEQQCLEAIKKGRKKISAKLILNWIRWNEYLKTDDKNFKINDAYQAYFARMFVNSNPEHREIFNFRKLRNEDSGPYMNVDNKGQTSFL